MAPKKEKPARTARRVRMVEKKLAGKSVSAIARDEGISRAWAGKELDAPESRQIISSLVDQSLDRITILYNKALGVIDDALGAMATVNFQGVPVELGPDHYARLTAAKRLLELVTAGRPTPKPPVETEKSKTVTLAELEQLVGKKKSAVVQ